MNVLCSWEKHFTLTVPVFTQKYNGVLENFQESLMKCFFFGGVGGELSLQWTGILSRGKYC